MAAPDYSPEEQLIILDGLANEFETFSGSFLPLLPDRVTLGLMADHLNEFLDITNSFTPVSSYVNKKARSNLQNKLFPPEDFSEFFEMSSYVPISSNTYFLNETDTDGKAKTTLKRLNTSIGFFEVSVMTFELNWGMLEAVAGLAATIIKPARDITNNVKTKMGEFIDNPNKTRVQAHTKQIGWVSQLITAQQLLTGITSSTSDGETDAWDSANQMQHAQELFEGIQNWINPDFPGNQGDPHDDAWRVANQRLGNLSTSLIGTNSASTTKALSACQSVRLSLLRGQQEDSTLWGKCENFRLVVEGIPEFPEWKAFWESLFGELNQSELGSKLAGALQYGNLSALLAEAGIPEEFMDWILGCLDFASVEDYDDIIQKKLQKIQEDIMNTLSQTLQLPSFPEFERWNKLKDELLDGLKDKLAQFEEVIAQIEDPKNLLHFTSYELDVEDPCSIESLFDALAELVEQLTKETQETIEEIAASLGGNIVAILVMVLADFVTSELAALSEQWMQQSLFGDALKALMNQIAMLLLAIEGAKLFMQYLAVVALQNQIYKRRELTGHLISQYTGLISILQKMKNIDAGEKDAFMEIIAAKQWVQKADGQLGIELTRVTAEPPQQVSKPRIRTALSYIEKGIEALAAPGGDADEAQNIAHIQDLLEAFNINVEVWVFTNNIMRKLAASIQERFFTVQPGVDYTRFLGEAGLGSDG